MTSTETFFKRLNFFLSVAHALHFRFTWYLSVTCIVMSVNWPLISLYMSGILCSLCVFCAPCTDCKSPEQQRRRLSSPDNFLPQCFYPCDVSLPYPAMFYRYAISFILSLVLLMRGLAFDLSFHTVTVLLYLVWPHFKLHYVPDRGHTYKWLVHK